MFVQNFKGIWDPKETIKLNKNDNAGFRQGGALSTTLLNIVLGKVIRNIVTNQNGTLVNRMGNRTRHKQMIL
jgi:hypothetical protein